MEIVERSKQQVGKLNELLDEMTEMLVPRTNFVLDHFVVNQHQTPAQQRRQVLAELRSLMFSLADMNDDIELARLDIEECDFEGKFTPRKRVEIERRKLERNIISMEMTLKQRMRECEFLMGLLERLPKFTIEELEEQEVVYWRLRLSEQAETKRLGGAAAGDMQAILQMETQSGLIRQLSSYDTVKNMMGIGGNNAQNSGDLTDGNG